MRYNPKRSFEETWKLAVQLEKILPYNQIILEYRRPGAKSNPGPGWMNWIHISYSTEGNAKMAFTMIDDVVVDSSGNPARGFKGLFLLRSMATPIWTIANRSGSQIAQLAIATGTIPASLLKGVGRS